METLSLLLTAFFLLLTILVLLLLTSEGDLKLMSKRRPKLHLVEDKVFWITGASRGIGEVLAKQLASLGAKLILSARNETELERVKNQLTGKHAPHEVKILPFDLASSEDSLKEVVLKAESFFPATGVDCMIHNAAYERPKSAALDVPEEGLKVTNALAASSRLRFSDILSILSSFTLKATFDINVFGTISLTRLLAPFMLRRGGGRFVVMSSAAGKVPTPGQAVYAASKFALTGYFHSLRSELFHKGIKVTIVFPGPVETSNGYGAARTGSTEKRISSERCAELTIIALTHGLKEAWISCQPVLAVLYLVQYMPTIGYWLMDKIGGNRVTAAANKGNTYSLSLLLGKKKET